MGDWLRSRAQRLAAGALALGVGAMVAVGCGSSGSGSGSGTGAARSTAEHTATTARITTAPHPPTTTPHPPTTTPTSTTPGGDRLGAGRALFRANCAACHTLADAGAHGTKAGGESNFDEIRPNSSSVANFLEHRFGAMPLFRGRLSQAQIHALARYVATADGCGASSPTSCTGR